MALSVRTTATGGNTVSGTNPTVVITPAVSDLFLVFCTANGNTNASPTCSDGNTGGSYSLLFTALKNGSADTISCFVRNNLVPNTTSTTVTVAIGAHTATEVGVVAISGATLAGTAAIFQTATQANQAGATVPAPVFGSACNPSSLILSMVGNGTNPGNVTATGGTVPTWTRNINAGQTVCGLCVQSTPKNFSGTTVTWGGTSASAFASGAVEVIIAPSTGVDASKLLAYGLVGPPSGVDTSKLVSYGLLGKPLGVDVSKLVAYGLLGASNTNPPVWPSFSMPSGYVGNTYSVTWDLAPAAPPTTYTVVSGSLPPGLTLNNISADKGSITGIPTTVGVYTFTLNAINVYGTANQPFSITITIPTSSIPLVWVA